MCIDKITIVLENQKLKNIIELNTYITKYKINYKSIIKFFIRGSKFRTNIIHQKNKIRLKSYEKETCTQYRLHHE